jgi:hypothetical protein
MSKVQELYEQAMKLEKKELEELATRLWDAVALEPPGDELSTEEWQRVWADEIVQRSERYHRGETTARDAFVALEDARRRLREKHGQ